MEPDLSGRVAVVFGAGSSGPGLSIGEATARAYAAAGARVACVDRDGAEAERVAALIRADAGSALAVCADVTRDADVAGAVSRVLDAWGPPDVLHNNVGLAMRGSVLDLSPTDWDAGMAANLTGCFHTVRHVLPHMLARGRGVVVNVSSLASIRDTGYTYPVYSAAKAAVNQFTVSLALTYAGRGIRANAVLPGLIDTPLVARHLVDDPSALAAETAARHARSPTGRMGTPWQVADVAVFLASDRASYVNGVCLPVDGGLAARTP